MIQTKLLHLQNSKSQRTQFNISVLLIAVGVLLWFNQIGYEINYSNEKSIAINHSLIAVRMVEPEFNIGFGLWTIPLILGVVLFCNVFMPMDLSNKNVKYQLKKYYRYKKRELLK